MLEQLADAENMVSVADRDAAAQAVGVHDHGDAPRRYGAPAATAVPGPSMDGGVATMSPGSSVTLFGGMVPPNGFMVRVFTPNGYYGIPAGPFCFVNDNGAAGSGVGFYMVPDIAINFSANEPPAVSSATFTSPYGYKPIGPVSIYCQGSTSPLSLAARGW